MKEMLQIRDPFCPAELRPSLLPCEGADGYNVERVLQLQLLSPAEQLVRAPR